MQEIKTSLPSLFFLGVGGGVVEDSNYTTTEAEDSNYTTTEASCSYFQIPTLTRINNPVNTRAARV